MIFLIIIKLICGLTHSHNANINLDKKIPVKLCHPSTMEYFGKWIMLGNNCKPNSCMCINFKIVPGITPFVNNPPQRPTDSYDIRVKPFVFNNLTFNNLCTLGLFGIWSLVYQHKKYENLFIRNILDNKKRLTYLASSVSRYGIIIACRYH